MKTMTKVTVHNFKTGDLIGSCRMAQFHEYDTRYPAPANPGAVRAGDWLAEDATGSLNIDPDTTVWFEKHEN